MNYLYLIIPASLLLLLLILTLIFHFKKKSVIRKVKSFSTAEKKNLLDSLAEPVGYVYDPHQDIFVSRLDAPQKVFGYTSFFDFSAPYFNMVFDYETVYFNYNGRTWLIEMWKGQYGINTGCELGVYYADTIVPPHQYNSTIFEAVKGRDMPDISLVLGRRQCHETEQCRKTEQCRIPGQCSILARLRNRHWWLTIFRMGLFTTPQELSVDISIRFRDYNMLYSFLESFKNTLPDTACSVNGLTVSFTFTDSHRKYNFFKKLVRHIALSACRIYCKWFNYVTRPFTQSGDKLLYIYFYLPFVIRSIFKHKK